MVQNSDSWEKKQKVQEEAGIAAQFVAHAAIEKNGKKKKNNYHFQPATKTWPSLVKFFLSKNNSKEPKNF